MTDALFTYILSVCFVCIASINLAEVYYQTRWKRRAISLLLAVSAALALMTLLARVQ